ncbi:MAG: hypothetical protein SVV03_02130 [Candidatus Nanohaloarchaea archaeon]|nr:hypothetical protein [Candidatus Nanohaloarchaea archaeon]
MRQGQLLYKAIFVVVFIIAGLLVAFYWQDIFGTGGGVAEGAISDAEIRGLKRTCNNRKRSKCSERAVEYYLDKELNGKEGAMKKWAEEVEVETTEGRRTCKNLIKNTFGETVLPCRDSQVQNLKTCMSSLEGFICKPENKGKDWVKYIDGYHINQECDKYIDEIENVKDWKSKICEEKGEEKEGEDEESNVVNTEDKLLLVGGKDYARIKCANFDTVVSFRYLDNTLPGPTDAEYWGVGDGGRKADSGQWMSLCIDSDFNSRFGSICYLNGGGQKGETCDAVKSISARRECPGGSKEELWFNTGVSFADGVSGWARIGGGERPVIENDEALRICVSNIISEYVDFRYAPLEGPSCEGDWDQRGLFRLKDSSSIKDPEEGQDQSRLGPTVALCVKKSFKVPSGFSQDTTS